MKARSRGTRGIDLHQPLSLGNTSGVTLLSMNNANKDGWLKKMRLTVITVTNASYPADPLPFVRILFYRQSNTRRQMNR